MSDYGIVSITGTPSTAGTSGNTVGWAFEVGNESITVDGLRVLQGANATKIIKIWDMDEELLGEVEVSANAGEWAEGYFDDSIELAANTEYVLGVVNTVTNWYHHPVEDIEFDSKLSYTETRFISNTTGFPGTSAATSIYGIPDIIIASAILYKSSGTYTAPVIDTAPLPDNLRIRWTATTPVDTSITVEYSLTELNTAPGIWTEVSESDVINLNDNYLWIRYTLETTDNEVTPTLEELWLEETAADPTQISLTCFPLERFQNIEGNLTINYDSALGNLEGLGGIVDSFEEVFTPDDLERIINPHLFENLKCVPTVDVIFARIFYMVVGDGDWPTDDERSITYVREYDAGPPEVLEQQKGVLEAEKLLCKPTISLTLIHVDAIDP